MFRLGRMVSDTDIYSVLFTIITSDKNEAILNRWGIKSQDTSIIQKTEWLCPGITIDLCILPIDGYALVLNQLNGQDVLSGSIEEFRSSAEIYSILMNMEDMINQYFEKRVTKKDFVL